jgi:hypothetical protein
MTPVARHASFTLFAAMGLAIFTEGCGRRPPGDAATPSRPHAETQEAVMPQSSTLKAEVLTERASAALPNGGLGFRLTPALPAAWPPPAAGSAALEWFAYAARALPTGVIAYEVSGPAHHVTLTLPSGGPLAEVMAEGTAKGREESPGAAVTGLAQAQQALVDVLTGTRKAEAAKTDLKAYLAWAQSSPVIGADVRKRKAAFFAWLESGNP